MYLYELDIRKNKKNIIFEENLKKYKDKINKNNIKLSKLKMKKKITDLQSENEIINIKINQLIKENDTNENIILNNYYLYNILSNEMIKIICGFNELKQMIEYLIYSKYKDNKLISDEEFINKFKDIFNKYSKNF